MKNTRLSSVLQIVRRSQKASSTFKSVYKSGTAAYGMGEKAVSSKILKLEKASKAPGLFSKYPSKVKQIFSRTTSGVSSFGTRLFEKLPESGKAFVRSVGRNASRAFKVLNIAVDIWFTAEIVGEVADWVNAKIENGEDAPSQAEMENYARKISEERDYTHSYQEAATNFDPDTTDRVVSRIRRGLTRVIDGDTEDNAERIQEVGLLLDALPRIIDDEYTGEILGNLLMAVGACIINEIPYTVLPGKILKTDLDKAKSFFGEARDAYEIRRSMHESLIVEIMDGCIITPMNANELRGEDANGAVLTSFSKNGYSSYDIRLKKYDI
jgi:hypothetical protein